jgi:hypothetical protein
MVKRKLFKKKKLNKLARAILKNLITHIAAMKENSDIERAAEPDTSFRPKQAVGRPKSIYNAQVHFRVHPKDERRFKAEARRLGIQHGELFRRMLKRYYDAY